MAFTTGQTGAQMITELQSVNAALNADAINTMLSSLAAGVQAPIGTPIMFAGVLVKATTGWGTPTNITVPVYAYDAAPA